MSIQFVERRDDVTTAVMACCSDNIVEANGEDVIDFEAVRADFESAKGI